MTNLQNRRQVLAQLLASGLASTIVPASAGSTRPLSWKHFQADGTGFLRAPVLLSGAKDAILIDGGFTLSNGRAVAQAIQASGKNLTTVYVSQGDPDYYFGLGPIRHAFPDARVIAAPATVEAIKASVRKKLEVWAPQLGENGPKALADIVMPQVDAASNLTLEGEQIEVIDASPGLVNRRYVWVPSLDAIFGGVLVFGGLHVWTADTPKREQRAAWVETLDAMAARKPKVVVPGHLAPGTGLNLAAIYHTRDYLLAFEDELSKAKDSARLIAAMKARYPAAGLDVSLDIGAKVAMGEMNWG